MGFEYSNPSFISWRVLSVRAHCQTKPVPHQSNQVSVLKHDSRSFANQRVA